jgi:hypothetical protein
MRNGGSVPGFLYGSNTKLKDIPPRASSNASADGPAGFDGSTLFFLEKL